jgi:ubiquinone/menaquinone biosynthesis C-methylase UbiE
MDKNYNKEYSGYYDESQFKVYLGLESSSIFQDMIRYTIEKNLPDLTNKTGYDIGFGTGFCMKILLKRGIKFYTGIDLSSSMMPYIESVVKENDWLDKVNFIFDDATKRNLIHKDGPFDVVTNSCAIYVYNYDKLQELCSHMYNNTKKHTGELFLVAYHLDFIHSQQRLATLDKYCHYVEPKLKENEKYADFELVRIIVKRPYFENVINFEEEPVISQDNLKKALQESGYRKIQILDMQTRPGYEHLLDFHRAFGVVVYKCTT